MTDQERLAALKATVAELEAKIEKQAPPWPTLEDLERAVKNCSCASPFPGQGEHQRAADILRDLRVRGGKLLAECEHNPYLIPGAEKLLRDLGVVPTP